MCGFPSSLGPLTAGARSVVKRLAGLALCTVAMSCGGPGAATSAAERAGGSPVEIRDGHDYPSLSLVARDGDPFAAIAIGVAHDFGATASVWLAALLEERGRTLPHPPDARPSAGGIVLRARADGPDEASRVVRFARDALARPVAPAELAKVGDRARTAHPLRAWLGVPERAAGECVGELGTDRPADKPQLADVERWRKAVFTAENVAIAVVGPRAVLDAAASTLRDTESWPGGDGAEDPWPAADVVGAYPLAAAARTLSVALRVAEPARAIEAARTLGARDSDLAAHVSALDPAWTVERVVGTTRPRGACLRLDLRTTGRDVRLRAAADVAALVVESASRALASAKASAWSLDRPVLESWDPRDAAAIAAWRALSGKGDPGPPRTFMSYAHPAGDADADAGFAALVAQSSTERRTSSVDVRPATEPGQGELWFLLASPCATSSETSRSAGIAALTVRTLAAKAHPDDGTRVEAWASPEGVGLLAHGPRLSAEEPSARHAARVAAALGRAVAGAPIGADDVAPARAAMQAALDPETEPLWPVTLEALSPKRPSLLDPRGTWQSVTDLSTQAAEIERRAILRGPLRLALLGPEAQARAGEVALALEGWLRPERAQKTRCPAEPTAAPHPGEYEVDAPNGSAGSRGIVAVTVPGASGVPVEAEWTAFLLNRPGGWLERAVRAPGLAARAEATVLGGGDAVAIAVEFASPGTSARQASAQVRALFSRLAEGTVTSDELAAARAAFDEVRPAASVDPRRRIVDLWVGRAARKLPDLAALRSFHRQVLAPERHVVVLTRPR